MNIRDLSYLVAVAENNHFGRAAEACFVSQPALSMQIKKLEETLGVVLIERTNKRLLLTDVGVRIIQQAREILKQVQNLHDIAKQASSPFCGELHLGMIPTLAPYLLPLVFPALSELFPQLSLYLIEDTTLNLVTKLQEGKLDGALLALPIEGDFTMTPLFEEPFFLAAPPNHPLSKQKTVQLADLVQETLLLLEEGHCLRDQALAVCHAAHASEFRNFRATSLETLRHMVAAGVGITLMPALSRRVNDGVHYVPFEPPGPQRKIGMIWRKSTVKITLLKHIASHIRQQRL